MNGISDYHDYDYHSHHEYEIYFFHSGSCRYLIDNQIYDLKPGDIILMDGLTLHKPTLSLDTEYVRSIIHFQPDFARRISKALNSSYLLDAFKIQSYYLIRTNENQESRSLELAIEELERIKGLSSEHHSTKETELKLQFLNVLVSVYKLTQMSGMDFTREYSIQSEHAEAIATYIKQNYIENLSLDSISNALSLSKSYASRLFKQMTGFTIMEYVMACRLNQTKFLLETEPDKSIKDIAFESGFESAAHFSSYFRSKVGQTARQYRNQRLR